jgi:hypothetical protein
MRGRASFGEAQVCPIEREVQSCCDRKSDLRHRAGEANGSTAVGSPSHVYARRVTAGYPPLTRCPPAPGKRARLAVSTCGPGSVGRRGPDAGPLTYRRAAPLPRLPGCEAPLFLFSPARAIRPAFAVSFTRHPPPLRRRGAGEAASVAGGGPARLSRHCPRGARPRAAAGGRGRPLSSRRPFFSRRRARHGPFIISAARHASWGAGVTPRRAAHEERATLPIRCALECAPHLAFLPNTHPIKREGLGGCEGPPSPSCGVVARH